MRFAVSSTRAARCNWAVARPTTDAPPRSTSPGGRSVRPSKPSTVQPPIDALDAGSCVSAEREEITATRHGPHPHHPLPWPRRKTCRRAEPGRLSPGVPITCRVFVRMACSRAGRETRCGSCRTPCCSAGWETRRGLVPYGVSPGRAEDRAASPRHPNPPPLGRAHPRPDRQSTRRQPHRLAPQPRRRPRTVTDGHRLRSLPRDGWRVAGLRRKIRAASRPNRRPLGSRPPAPRPAAGSEAAAVGPAPRPQPPPGAQARQPPSGR